MSWNIKEVGFDQHKIIHRGNQFLIGHLKLGVRGTLDEMRKEALVAVHLPLVYDQVGDGWREPVNAFNPLFTQVFVNGVEVGVMHQNPYEHEQNLSLKDAVMSRKSAFHIDGNDIVIESKRFVSDLEERAILVKYSVTASQPCKIEIKTGIDGDIWDIHGPHIEKVLFSEADDVLVASGVSHEKKNQITVLKSIDCDFKPVQETINKEDKGIYKLIEIDASAHQTYTVDQYIHIGVDEKDDVLKDRLHHLAYKGFDQHLKRHQQSWLKKWDIADVKIEGDEKADLSLRYSIYHLLILAPSRYDHASIPARGISGQTYKGAIFWDTEIFMLPFYLNHDLESAKKIIEYRIQGLKGALEKAKSYGFKGAFYAWESQDDGHDACTDYNVTDVFTKRLIRTYFKDKQVHISGDVVYAMMMYMKRTGDYEILHQGGLNVILEVARFYLDYGHYAISKDRFEVWDVMGPDEYHERVHNNAFTNQLVKMVFETVLNVENYFIHQKSPIFEELVRKMDFEDELKTIKEIISKVYIKEVNDDLIIEQFDGYFKLKDITKKDLFEKKLHPNEYLGGQGLAGDTKIIKQADVIAMLYLFKEKYSKQIMKANWDYYEPRTEHGSSLSASMYALTACLTDNPDYAYPLFMKSATVDLTGESKHYAGDVYIGGTHPAASGGAYMTVVHGFAGCTFSDQVSCIPLLPKSITSIRFKAHHLGKTYEICVKKDTFDIKELTK